MRNIYGLANKVQMGFSFGYVFATTKEELAQLREEIEPIVREHRQVFQFGIADPSDVEDIVDDLRFQKPTRFPAFAIREPIANLRYPMNETKGWFVGSLISFLEEYLKDTLQPTIKSEPLPGKSDDAPALVKVVGLNYQEIVMGKEKDVLLTFCITPCNPCEVLQPTIEALAEVYASRPSLSKKVTVAKVMYDENDTSERDIRAFPTILLFPAASKDKPERFVGPRTLDDLATFIREHGYYKADMRDVEEK
jgi:protein disulfide-isomerase A1